MNREFHPTAVSLATKGQSRVMRLAMPLIVATLCLSSAPAMAAASDVVAALPGGPVVLAVYVLIIACLLYALVAARRRASRPLGELTAYLEAVASGSEDGDVPHIDRNDEIGAMARSVQGVRLAVARERQIGEQAHAERSARDLEDAEEAALRTRQDENRQTMVDDLSDGLERLAEGDLTTALDRPFAADYEPLRQSFNKTVRMLDETLGGISGVTENVRSGSSDIARAADDLSRRTEQQAAALEQTAAALDEITATVRSSSEAAEEAGKMVGEAKDGTQKSGGICKNAITAMERIQQSSDKISQIIGVIDEIAFQTNLLALNAGVEAARAGDAGKGFAVVAQEVRELAQRTATAAKEIKDLITNSATEVGDGVALVSQTGDALQEIEQHVLRINERVDSIITSSQEQSAGLQEINTAINQMDQVTQQNAAMVEQTNAACQELNGESGKLTAMVSRFASQEASIERPVAANAPAPATRTARQTASGGTVRPPAAAAATPASRPVDSPAHKLERKLAGAFGTAPSAPSAGADDDWTEF